MTTFPIWRGALLAACMGSTAWAATPPAGHINFVACPIVRDTKTVPCWLSQYNGETYYLGIQVDFGAEFWPPYLGHKVLVEGQVTDQPRICGGVVLKPMKMSVMPEADDNCHTMLPAEDRFTVDFPTRGPGPNNRPSLNVPPRAPPPAAAPLSGQQQFTILFDFDNRVWNVRATQPMQRARDYALASHASKVEVAGFRGASLLSDGSTLAEGQGVAEMRAKQVREILEGVGVPSAILSARWDDTVQPANGVDDPTRRKVVITVTP